MIPIVMDSSTDPSVRLLAAQTRTHTSLGFRRRRNRARSSQFGARDQGGLHGIGSTGASAQAVYVDPYVEPYPVVAAPGSAHVASTRIIAPSPIARERVVIGGPAYVPAPVHPYVAPLTPYEYSGYGYAADVVADPEW